MANENSPVKWREQINALKHLPAFFRMIWHTHPGMALGNVLLRLLKSVIPLMSLYVGKLIIDEVIRLMGAELRDLNFLWLLVAAELGLALASDLLNRGITLLDGLLGDLFSNRTSEQLIRHAATLDLYQFEDPSFYDKLERARRETTGRTVLMSMALSQVQDIITVLFLGAGLAAFNLWLILILALAVIPSFLGESYFNQQSYSLTRGWTPERRELDYLRYIGASDQTAKEVKVFGLSDFIADRFAALSASYYKANRALSVKRAGWGAVLSAVGTLSYYGAFVFILLQTVGGTITVGTLTFLAGSFSRMHSTLQGVMSRFSRIAEGALYLQDLFDFFEIKPTIVSRPAALPFPKPLRQGFSF
ncbi:MAG TPA: ABC transporter ATP-binding protein, partial [Saprospiraceae bacterium]|nr:ABC transporter ATP-binding protein [Saprospiraceae bacterium]